MEKCLIGATTAILFFFIVIPSYADMKITPGGMASSSGNIHQSGSFSSGDHNNDLNDAVISGVNNYSDSDNFSIGGYFEVVGAEASAVVGIASSPGNVHSYGGYFRKKNGGSGAAVYGSSNDSSENFTSYGGLFHASGAKGIGVKGSGGVGDDAKGVVGQISTGNGTAVYGRVMGPDSTGKAIHGKATNNGTAKNYGGYFEVDGYKGQGVYSEATGGSSIGVYGKATGANSTGVYGEGVNYNFYANGPGADYGTFTGAHDVKFSDTMPRDILPGMIVSVTGQTLKKTDKNGKISLSSTLPTITLSKKVNDKTVFGIILFQSSLPEGHWYAAEENERFGVVNALGEGCVWVTDINGKIEAGDYITTSSIPGYGQLQNDDILHSYTLGKAIETVDFAQQGEEISFDGKIHKAYLMAVVYTSG